MLGEGQGGLQDAACGEGGQGGLQGAGEGQGGLQDAGGGSSTGCRGRPSLKGIQLWNVHFEFLNI